jgi:hypothetical protein
MKYAVEMGSGAMIYIASFIKIGSGIQNLIRGGIHRHRQHGDGISLLLFFQSKESKLNLSIFLTRYGRRTFGHWYDNILDCHSCMLQS